MKETEVTARIVKEINSHPAHCYAKKRHSGKFGSGDPDIAGVYLGRAFFIETKVVGGELTQLQAMQLTRWREVGAITALAVYSPETREIKFIMLHDSEQWENFTGHAKLSELLETTAAPWKPLKTLDISAWLEMAEFHVQKGGH